MKPSATHRIRVLLGAVALLLARPALAADADSIHSAVEGSRLAAVSTANGVFEASQTERQWRPIPHPDSMPLPGILVGNPDPGGALYHFTVRGFEPGANQGDPAKPLPVPPAWQYGLYRRTAAGTAWERVSDEPGFVHVLAVSNRLFAVTVRPDRPEDGQRILESTNGGVRWQALPGNPITSGSILRLFPDPDAPGRPALLTVGLRGMILRLASDGSGWEETRQHRMPRAFLAAAGLDGGLWVRSESPRTNPNLQTYFQFPRSLRISPMPVPAAWIGAGGRREFKAGTEVIVVARIRTGPGFPIQRGRRFVDSGDDHKAWGFRRWTPSGATEEYPPVGLPKPATERVELEPCTSDSDPGILLSLSSRAAFTQPGRYRVQLVYDTLGDSHGRAKEWAVRLLSEPFEIEVK